MQATIRSGKAYSSDTRSGNSPPLALSSLGTEGLSPVNVHVIKAYYIGTLTRIILRKGVRAKIITHTLSAASVLECRRCPARGPSLGEKYVVSRYW